MRVQSRTIGFGVVAAGLLGGLALSWVAGSTMVRGRATPVAPPPAPAQELRLRTDDGVSLAASYWLGARPDARGILLLHGVDGSRAATEPNAAWLAGLGYAVLTIDFRGHGQSTLSPRSFGLNESEDARTAFNWLKHRQGGARVAVIGISMGGAAALLGRDGPLPADALVLQAVYPDIRHAIRDRIAMRLGRLPALLLEPLLSFQSRLRFGVWPSALSPLEALRRYRGPVFIVAGRQDRYTPPVESQALSAIAAAGSQIWFRPTGDHGAVCDAQDADYRARILAFLKATIGSE